jgi:zinc protease
MLDRTVAPPFKKIDKIDIKKAQTTQLSNGLPVHQILAGKQPVTKVEIVLQSGKWFEGQEGVAFFTGKMISEGTIDKSASEISNFIDQYGAYLEINPGYDYITLAIYSLEKHMPHLVPLLHELLFSASFPQVELDIMKNMVRQEIKLKQEKTSIVALKKFRETIFKNHPYGKDLGIEQINAIDNTLLIDYYEQFFKNSPEFIISGNFTEDTISLIEQYFSREKIQNIGFPAYSLDYKPLSLLIEKPKSSQSSLKVGKLLFNKTHPEYLKMLIVNEILGGYFGSRLMKNIREQKGYTYGIYSRMINFRASGYFVIGADVKKEFTVLALEEIYKEIEKLQTEPVSDEELGIVKNQMLGSFLNEINSPFALAEKFKTVHYHNLDYSFYQSFVQQINTITSEEIMYTAKKHLQRESLSEVVVGGIN